MSQSPTTAPPAPAGGRPPLRRPKEGRILTGVAAGVAQHLGVDVAIVRILLVVLTVLTQGLLALAYVAAIFLIPEATEQESAAVAVTQPREGSGDRDPLFWVGIGILVIGVIWLLSAGGPFFASGWNVFRGDLLLPLVLVALGVALWRSGDRRGTPAAGPSGAGVAPESSPAPAPQAPTAFSTGAPPASAAIPGASNVAPDATETPMTTDTRPTEETQPIAGPPATGPGGWTHDTQVLPPVGPPPPPTAQGPREPWSPPPTPEPRERSILPRLTIGLAFVVAGILWSLRLAGVLFVSPGQILASALLVLGLGLLVGSVVGRGRWLLLAGGLLAPLVLLSIVARPYGLDDWRWTDSSGRVGDITEHITDVDDVRSSYEYGAGSIRVDLSDLELDGAQREISLRLGAGELLVLVPDDVDVEVTAQVGIGQLDLGASTRTQSGLGLRGSVGMQGADGDGSTLALDLSVGVGSVEVRTVPGSSTTGERDLPPVPEAVPDPEAELEPDPDLEPVPAPPEG